MTTIQPKLIKIIKHEDYDFNCVECGRKIKKAFSTDQGYFGTRCFWKSLGYKFSSAKKIKIEDFSQDVLIALSKRLVSDLENLSFEEFTKLTLYWNRFEETPLKFPILYKSKLFMRVYPKEKSYSNRFTSWINLSLIPKWDVFAEIGKIPKEIIKGVIKQVPFTEWWQKEGKIATNNPLGLPLEKIKAFY